MAVAERTTRESTLDTKNDADRARINALLAQPADFAAWLDAHDPYAPVGVFDGDWSGINPISNWLKARTGRMALLLVTSKPRRGLWRLLTRFEETDPLPAWVIQFWRRCGADRVTATRSRYVLTKCLHTADTGDAPTPTTEVAA